MHAAKIVLIAVAYYAAAKLGLDLAFETSSVTAVWPPTGIALAALVIWGPSMWPGVALGALAANAWTGVPVVSVLGIASGNTLEAVVGAWLLRRARFRPALERVRDVLALVLLAAGLSTVVSATIGVLSLAAGDEVAWSDFGSVWRVWWLGDMGGDLLVAPLLLVAAAQWPFRDLPGRALEAAALAAATVGLGIFIFTHETNLAYLNFPLLIWAALRFRQPGAATASFALATVAVIYTANGEGPFMGSNPDESLLLAQTYWGISGVTALLLAAVLSERRHAEESMEEIARTLQESLLPVRLPAVPGVELAARFQPAGARYRVGGDFYDVFNPGDGTWALVIGDVCGKGPAAAAVTGLARYTLRAAAAHDSTPSRVLTRLNKAIRHQRPHGDFCTIAYARLDGRRLTFSTGGHPLPLLLRARGGVAAIGTHGLLIGPEAEPDLVDHEVDLEPGDVVLLYTDGLTDAYAPARPFEPGDVEAVLASCGGLTAAEIADRVHRAVTALGAGEPRDDIAIMVARVTAASD